LDTLLTFYYRARGWNENGIPTKETLERVGLHDIAAEMESIENHGVDQEVSSDRIL
jgi:aldehyde:ferredoxin oxidoreductase